MAAYAPPQAGEVKRTESKFPTLPRNKIPRPPLPFSIPACTGFHTAPQAQFLLRLVLVANRGCVSMFAPPLCRVVGPHFVSTCCRRGGRQMLLHLLRQLLIFE